VENSRETSLENLENGQKILSYCGFSSQYRQLSPQTCQFVRHNFPHTTLTVLRQDVKHRLPSAQLEPGDTLLSIGDFPAALKKITIVSPGLIAELGRRGMKRFQVENRPKSISGQINNFDLKALFEQVQQLTRNERTHSNEPNRNPHRRAAHQVNELIEKVGRGLELRDRAAEAIEQTMDRLRHGVVDLSEIRQSLKTIDTSTEAMATIVSLKQSELVYEHSIDVGVIFKTVYQRIADKLPGPKCIRSESQLLLAGFLHDIGKAKIPKCVLHHTAEFPKNSRELQLIRSHPVFGARLLEDLNMPAVMVNMARYHHVKKETTMLNSYPQAVDWRNVAFETRLLSIVDIYQSLVGRRRYKKSWSAGSALRFIESLAGIEFDLRAWHFFSQEMGVYPVGSMVELNDGSLGFVVNSTEPNRRPERPLVAVTRNQSGDDLTHPHLLDLHVERGFRIVRDVDYQSVYGDQAIEVFTNMAVT
jgi:HD-GYP domain-containing protein (c-di-GMP phosphodiesterase class II)